MISSLGSEDLEDADEYVFLGGVYEQLADLYLEKWSITSSDLDHAKSEAALSTAIEQGLRGANLAEENDQKGSFWAVVAQRSNYKYELFSDTKDLNKAIEYYETGLRTLSSTAEMYPAVLINQANCLTTRFENGSDGHEHILDLDKAISNGDLARSLISGDKSTLARMNNDVSTMHLTRFEWKGSDSDLKTALELADASVASTLAEDSSLAIRKLNLANCHRTQYECTGDRDALEKAIDLLDAAEKASQTDEAAPRAQILSSLAHVLYLRYEAVSTASDLFDAIKNATTAADIARANDDQALFSVILSNIAAFQQAYSEETKELEDLNDAIQTCRLALEFLTNKTPRRAMCLYHLSSMLKIRSEFFSPDGSTDQERDLDDAISMAIEATDISSVDMADSAKRCDLLSRLFQTRFLRSGEKDNSALDEAIKRSRQAVRKAQENIIDRADYMIQLGDVLKLKYDHEPSEQNFGSVASAYNNALNMGSASPLSRIIAGHKSGLLYQSRKLWIEASETLEQAVRLMPKVAASALERDSQQRTLLGLTSIPLLAASMALQTARGPAVAFEIMETGRGIIADLVVRTKAATFEIEGADDGCRELLEEYTKALENVQVPVTAGWLAAGYSAATYGNISKRVKDWEKVASIESELKRDYGIDLSRRTLSETELRGLASDGFIVAFVISQTRSDAFIISSSGVSSLELPGLKLDKLTEHYIFMNRPVEGALRSLSFENFYDINESMKRLLIWLWDIAVRPVLQHLKIYSSNPGKPNTRIHWITTGPMGFMPLHAAGTHDGESTENTLSHAISSYTTNAKSLARLRSLRNKRSWNSQPLKTLIIAMPETPFSQDLGALASFDNIPDHETAISRLVPAEHIAYLSEPSSSDVLDQLPYTSIAHFVCHGISQSSDPSNSSLLLCKDADADPGRTSSPAAPRSRILDPLTVRAISTRALSHARLAFLAACQTADNASVALLEESIHLVSSFMLLGFPDVVGTFWEAEPTAAAKLADGFYEVLAREVKGVGEERECGLVARACHEAMLQVRSLDQDEVVTWAAFVHFGG